MANLAEQKTYDAGIYQIETDDVVIGGPEGISNKSAKNLANRTAWIKQQIDNVLLEGSIAADDSNLTSLAAAIAGIASENSSPLSSAIDSASTTTGATSNAVKLVNDALSLLSQAVNGKAASDHTHVLPDASTSLKGLVQLDSSLASDSEITAATSKAIKAVNDALQAVIQDVVALNTMLVGAPIPWPSAVVPAGCLEYRGQAFNPVTYPILAGLYPSNFLIDLRGEFIRGWDNSKGTDAGRSLLSLQADDIKSHTHQILNIGSSTGASPRNSYQGAYGGTGKSYANLSYTGGIETRPRNVAFMYITRAA
ncbi:MAG: hypothetical protein OFPI_00130 [Osedax symbiont Rs2]|nr:MAG: hypothetical protein OFPI_00130 [Osedax symbiont Rs2]